VELDGLQSLTKSRH